MKKKRISLCLGILICTMFLGGCANQIPGMTPEQEQVIGEFAAGLLVKYDKNHGSRLVDLTEEEVPASSQEPSQEKTGEDTAPDAPPSNETPTVPVGEETAGGDSVFTAEQILGLPEGVSLSFQSDRVAPFYPEDEKVTTVDASQGKKLLVLSFLLSNGSAENHNLSIFTVSPVFRVTVNGNYTRNVLTTMLPDDLSTFVEELAAGESRELVLLAEVDDEVASSISSVTLEVKNVSDSTTISLK